jgi:short-subunit dehydrogenase involved in D-alanine esterification of teichoic acids
MPWRQMRVESTSRSTPCPSRSCTTRPLPSLRSTTSLHPIVAYLRTNLIMAMAVARHMTAQRSGTILTLSAGASRVPPPGSLGYGTTGAAIETMTQRLAVAAQRAGALVGVFD